MYIYIQTLHKKTPKNKTNQLEMQPISKTVKLKSQDVIVYIFTCIYTVCKNTYIYICMYINIYIERERQIERERKREYALSIP